MERQLVDLAVYGLFVNIALVFVTTLYVLFTFFVVRTSQKAARAAEQAVAVTAKTSEASLFAGLLSEYSSDQMHEHLRILSKFKSYAEKPGIDFVTTCKAMYSNRSIDDTVAYHMAPFSIKRLDEARRHFDHFFTRAAALRKNDYVEDKLIKAIASYVSMDLWPVSLRLSRAQAEMEQARGGSLKYGTWHYELFKKILGNEMFDL